MVGTLNTPSNQQRHTNITVVKLLMAPKKDLAQENTTKKGKKKRKPKKMSFEIACYQNKVMDYRNGVEDDIENVLQTTTIFTKVADGIKCKKSDLQLYFGTSKEEEVAKIILEKGEYQISKKERELIQNTQWKDILNYVCSFCVNPETNRPYPPGVIEREMKNLHFNIKQNKSSKVQALNLIQMLQKNIPIMRAKMRIKLHMQSRSLTTVKKILKKHKKIEYSQLQPKEKFDPETKMIESEIHIDPGLFRFLDQVILGENGKLEVLDTVVNESGNLDIEKHEDSKGNLTGILKTEKTDSQDEQQPSKDKKKVTFDKNPPQEQEEQDDTLKTKLDKRALRRLKRKQKKKRKAAQKAAEQEEEN